MENPPVGSKHVNVKKSFKLAIRSLLTSCSKEDFCKAFAKFTSAEQEYLHKLFVQVITSLHGNVEDEFESLFHEIQVGTTLDTVEQLVEEQRLDPLHMDKTNLSSVVHDLTTAKKNEIQYLQEMLEKAEKQNQLTRTRIELLKKEKEEQDTSSIAEAVGKVKSGVTKYGK